MKRFLIAMSLILACGSSLADELGDGVKAFEQGAFEQAMQIYTKLANAGNAVAQEKLAEMHWYGEAGAIDLSKAEFWFKKSAEQGNENAKAALGVMRARVVRKDEIEYFTTRFDGNDVKLSKLGCVRPTIPAASLIKSAIVRVDTDLKAWADCYNRFVKNLNEALPAGKAIPKDLADLMSNDDLARAKMLMDKTYAAIAGDAEKLALAVNAESAAWLKATNALVAENEVQKQRSKQTLATINQGFNNPKYEGHATLNDSVAAGGGE